MKILNCMVDWLEFSILDSEFDFEKVCKLLDFLDFSFEHSRSFYYEDVYNYQNMIYIYENPKGATKNNKHVHVKFTGKGCRFLEQKYNNCIKEEMLARLMFINIKVSRLDVCIDTDTKFVSDLIDDAINYRFTTYKTRRIVMEESNTIYLGSTKSEKFIRIYEKDKESKDNKFIGDRVELVLKNEYATNEFYNRNNLYKIISTYLNQVEFESSKSQQIWISLQGEKCEISPSIRHSKSQLKDKIEYIITTYGKTLRAGVMAFGAKTVLSAISEELISDKLLRMVEFENKLRIYKQKRKYYKKLQILYDKMWFRNDFVQVKIC